MDTTTSKDSDKRPKTKMKNTDKTALVYEDF